MHLTPPQWSSELQEVLVQSNQRLVVDCAGDLDWCQMMAQTLVQNKTSLVLSDQEILTEFDVIPFNKSIQLLGQEFDNVIYDAFNGFDVDSFVRALGLIKAPGLFILIHPECKQWLQRPDTKNIWQNKKEGHHNFIGFLQKQLGLSNAVLQCRQDRELLSVEPLLLSPKTIINNETLLSEQQKLAWDQLQDIFNQKKSIALLAERGRGKSTLLGRWVSQKELASKKFIITSDSKKAVGACLNFSHDLQNVDYIAIDRLLLHKPLADCIVVDEAATIPVALLFELKRQYERVIYTSTLEGYEGTGQGFDLQFLASFTNQSLRLVEIFSPIRWGNHDLLETWMKDTFFINKNEKVEKQLTEVDTLIYQQITQQALCNDVRLFKQIFNLLKVAHYRTKASDLRMLLDNPDLTLFIAQSKSQVIAVMLLIAEGGLEKELSNDIFYGKRRPQGHLLAQGLTVHGGCEGFAQLNGFRVQRIAVAKAYRQQGIGSHLIQLGMEYAKHNEASYFGAVFALDEKRLSFWERNKMILVMVSVGQGTSTGRPSISMLHPLGGEAEQYKKQCQKALSSSFSERLLTHFKTMPASQVVGLLALIPSIGTNRIEQCDAYINGFRGFEYALFDLKQTVFFLMQQGDCPFTHDEQALLVRSILQYQPWPELIKDYSLSGQKELNQRIKEILRSLY